MDNLFIKTRTAIIVLALLITSGPVTYLEQTVSAGDLTNRSIRLSSSTAGATTSHRASFTISTTANMGSIEFEYCSNTPFVGTVCTAPTGLDLSSVSLTNQIGESGFTIDPSSTANRIIITRPSALSAAPVLASYTFNGAINPTIVNTTTFVRMSTFASTDATGPRTDYGSAAFAVNNGISVEAFVPPYLTFCVGLTVGSRCKTSAGNFINLGELSKTSPKFSTSQFSGATNDPGGYSTFLAGNTMTSGTNFIPAMKTKSISSPGVSQFGLNVVDNSNPDVGKNPQGIGSIVAANGYKTPNQFKFANEVVAYTTNSTEFNVVTVSYLVNASTEQKPGIYSTTITYIATAAF